MKINQLKRYFILSTFLMVCSTQLFSQTKSTTLAQGSYRNIYEMLRDVPGLDVKVTNGKAGGSVIVRGTSSLKNQQPPLIVLDGVIFGGDISTINAQDVDGISVLKDAATASVYGSQGTFGVIQITTKKGSSGASPASVSNHNESAYTYFIEHKTNLKVFGLNDEVLIEGIIQKQVDSTLVFLKKKKEFLVPIKSIKKVEMVQE